MSTLVRCDGCGKERPDDTGMVTLNLPYALLGYLHELNFCHLGCLRAWLTRESGN